MGSVGPTELLLIALVVVLIFGAGRIAEIGKGLGEGIKNFKKGLKDEPNGDAAQLPEHASDDEEDDDEEEEAKPKAKKPIKKTEKKVEKKADDVND